MPQHTRHPMLTHLDQLVGEWETEATHRLLPAVVVRGRSTFEWLEGGHFLIWRAHNEHPDFPDSISILGCEAPADGDAAGDATDGCFLSTFDSRGIVRHHSLVAEAGAFRFWRDWPGFSQRFIGTFSADGVSITGVAALNQDGATWEEDLWITYRRVR